MITMPAAPKVVEHVYRARGGIARLFRCRDPEILLDGPAGTGKSRGDGEYALHLADTFPGCRIGVIRKTRVSLTESWLATTWERNVLANGVDRTYLKESLLEGPGRANRQVYSFRNGSEMVICGMDNPTRLFSTEFDFFFVVEAIEFTENEWESLDRALRNNMAPHPDSNHPRDFRGPGGQVDVLKLRQAVGDGHYEKWGNRYPDGSPIFFTQKIGETNPGAKMHWLNTRCHAGKTTRIICRHSDNPSLTHEYLQRLNNLTGVRRKRLFLGEWCTAEGGIWDCFEQDKHVIDATLTHVDDAWQLVWHDGRPPTVLRWFFGDMDFGFRKPGCMHIWGVDRDRRVYCVREWYMSGKNANWWADAAEEAQEDFDPYVFICDCADPSSIDLLNDRLYKRHRRNVAFPCDKTKVGFEASANIVRDMMIGRGGVPDLMFLRDCLVSADPLRLEERQPVCTVDEIPGYVYRIAKDGQPLKEEPDPLCEDHGCDGCRYGMTWFNSSRYESPEGQAPARRGSADDVLGINAFKRRIARGDFTEGGTDADFDNPE